MSERVSFKVAVGTLHLENISLWGRVEVTNRQRSPSSTRQSRCKAWCHLLCSAGRPISRCPAQLLHFPSAKAQTKPCEQGDVNMVLKNCSKRGPTLSLGGSNFKKNQCNQWVLLVGPLVSLLSGEGWQRCMDSMISSLTQQIYCVTTVPQACRFSHE